MSEQFDPIEWLRRHDPLDTAAASSFDSENTLERLRSRRSAIRRRRNRRLVAAVVAVAGSSTAVAVAAIASRNSPEPASVVCFAAVDLNASRAVVDQGDDPIAACRQAWTDPAQGEVFVGVTPSHLAACRLHSGALAVFPADTGAPCAVLGLAEAETHFPDDEAVRQLEIRLVEHVDGDCVPVDELVTFASDQLLVQGLEEWKVTVDGPPNTDGCGSTAIDTAQRTVWIVPLPPMPSPAPPRTNT